MGWNIPYDWMNSDLKAGMTQVKMYVEEQDEVPWETLNVSVRTRGIIVCCNGCRCLILRLEAV